MANEIEKALLSAQEAMKGLHKDGTNDFAKFGYTSIEEVVKQCRQVLHANGLVFYPDSQDLRIDAGIVYVRQTYTLSHPASGQSKSVTRTMVVPENAKMSPCQSQGSAESYMLKNTLRELLLLPRFDKNEDLDSLDNTNHSQPVVAKARQFSRH